VPLDSTSLLGITSLGMERIAARLKGTDMCDAMAQRWVVEVAIVEGQLVLV
jgi:hypothetical protein